MKLKFALLLLITLSSYCECKGVGGRVVGSGSGRGGRGNAIKVRGSGRRFSASAVSSGSYGSHSGEWKKTSFENSKSSVVIWISGAPPAYPGLSHHPGSNHPPAYSPSFSRPPAYSATFTGKAYGSTFGKVGLNRNSYIAKNYFGGPRSDGRSQFLSSALFRNYLLMPYGSSDSSRSWNDFDDRRWRATTKAPYFDNKVPGFKAFLPAAAVIGKGTIQKGRPNVDWYKLFIDESSWMSLLNSP